MNLTAVKEVNEVMERHIEDSLAILPPLSDNYMSHSSKSIDKVKLVDVGTGAGLPGVVLAIARPGEVNFIYSNVIAFLTKVLLLDGVIFDV